MNTRKPPLVLGALLAIPLAVNAASAQHRCAEVQEDTLRLACYDSEFGKPRRAVEAKAAAPTAAPVPATGSASTSAEVQRVPAERASKSEADGNAVARRSGSVTSAIASVRRKQDGRLEVTLQNSEVWAQLEPDRNFSVEAGEAVTIRPAMLGSFQLVGKGGATTRVKRLK